MRTIFLCFCLLVFLGANNFLCAQEIAKGDKLYEEITTETLYPYFSALKNGDVSSIKQYLSAKMYQRYQVLLEKNKDYPNFLRNYYQNANFYIIKAEQINQDISVSVMIDFSNSQPLNSELILRKEVDDLQPNLINDRWKIIKQN
jgi:hypothetical protein